MAELAMRLRRALLQPGPVDDVLATFFCAILLLEILFIGGFLQ